MTRKAASRKRPCRICKRWFLPNPRLGPRQMTCGDKACQREWHRKKCEKWNRDNPDYFKSNYLQKKLKSLQDRKPKPQANPPPKLPSPAKRPITMIDPRDFQEVITPEQAVLIEYIVKQLLRSVPRYPQDAAAVPDTG